MLQIWTVLTSKTWTLYTLVQSGSTEDLYDLITPSVKFMVLKNGQKSVFAEYYDV